MPSGKQAPELELELGGRTRRLRFDLGALIDFEAESGLDLMAGGSDLAQLERDLSRPKNVALLVWAMLVHEDPELTWREVARWIHPGNVQDLIEKALTLAASDRAAAPDQEEPDQGNA